MQKQYGTRHACHEKQHVGGTGYGYKSAQIQTARFVLSTVYAGIGGIMFMSYLGYASPTNWTLMFSLNLLAAVIIGGTRSLWGTIVGCFIVFGLTPIFFQDIAFLRDNSWFMYALIGVLIILIIMFYQGGLVQLVRDIKNGIKKARAKRRLYRYGEEE